MKRVLYFCVLAVLATGLYFGIKLIPNREQVSLINENAEALTGCEIDGLYEGDFTVIFISVCHWRCEANGPSNCPL